MKYKINGKSISFNQNDFLAKGGQGSIYVKGSTVYKIYTDHSEMFTQDKMNELSVITDKKVIVPKEFIYDKDGKIVGFTMPYTPDTIPLIKLFNTGYREKASFDENNTLSLVEQMQHTIQHIHDNNILQIDGNELNYLVGDNLKTPYFIDVDSYQTKNHKATVIMPSIRDWQAKQFSTLTDWYSFGIVACQLFVGLHPYKGRHPNYKRDLKQRAIDHISIFNKDVSVPKAVRDFSNIPSEYMNWFIDIFEKGKRTVPPLVAGTLKLKPTFKVISGSNLLSITELTQLNKINNYVVLPFSKKIARVSIENRKLLIEGENVRINNLCCSEFFISNNSIYAKHNDKLYQVNLGSFNDVIIPAVIGWSISNYASSMFDGFVYQDLLGHCFFTIPYEVGKISTIGIKELDDYKIIDGKYENKVAKIIALNYKTKKYDKITLIFDEEHKKYKIETKEDSGYYLNFTVLETGVVLEIEKDGVMSMTLNRIDRQIVKQINDPIISTEWQLMHEGSQAMFKKDNKTFQLKMN